MSKDFKLPSGWLYLHLFKSESGRGIYVRSDAIVGLERIKHYNYDIGTNILLQGFRSNSGKDHLSVDEHVEDIFSMMEGNVG